MKGRTLRMLLLVGLVLGLGFALSGGTRLMHRGAGGSARETPPVSPMLISTAINGLDLDLAERLLRAFPEERPEAAVLRARFALHRGDCDEARAVLSGNLDAASSAVRDLSMLAEGCSRAMAAARIINDGPRAVWVRLQDDADASWVPLIADVAARAREFAARKLGVSPKLPLRIELVMDHASLSALTGLPLEAAETTGTVAVARWGRVTMLSPRAFPKGYPWQDTLAHEITHLLVTNASSDNAPLWMQEAIAKHLEIAWRPPRPLDGQPDLHEVARNAWLHGRSVGIDRLGASIAMLPNPDAANVAYAEVYDFLDHMLKHGSWAMMRLILRELRGLGPDGTDVALRSVTGYSLTDWIRRWHDAISGQAGPAKPTSEQTDDSWLDDGEELAKMFRLAELYASVDRYEAVSATLPQVVVDKLRLAEVHSLAGLARLQLGSSVTALDALGTENDLTSIQGEWLALRGRALAELGRIPQAANYFEWALAYAPTQERIACEGYRPSTGDFRDLDPLPISPARRPLCKAAKAMAVSAREPLPK